jgi:hypothetical protein
MRAARSALLVYGLLNAALYAGLLPLWEGWDEPFHYGCVQEISRQGRLPVLGRAVISREIWDSLDDVPVAEGVRKNIRKGITFGAYFRLTAPERSELRRRLEGLDPRTGSEASQSANYEAQQPPLSYLLVAPLDALWAAAPLPTRILRLRLVCAFLAVLLTAAGILRLANLLLLPAEWAHAALFVVFSSQMFYAATAHITNDWLAVPLFTLLMAQTVALYISPRLASAAWLGAILGAALLTKAYFLPAAPVVFAVAAVCVWRQRLRWQHTALAAVLTLAIAAPWYGGNVLHGNLSGMQETARGAPAGELARAALRLPWLATLWSTSHSALWTGNNSYMAFSGLTLTLMLVLLAAAYAIYIWRGVRSGFPAGERIVAAGILFEVLGLAYATVVFCWASRGAASTPSPWYWQALWPSGICLLTFGCYRGGSLGRWLALATAWVWTYSIAATYLAKLIPYYAGLSDGRTRLADLPHWYGALFTGSAGSLDTVALLPSGLLLGVAGLVVLSAVALAGFVSTGICYSRATGRS